MIYIACYQPLIRLESKTHFLTAADGHKYGEPKIVKTHSIEEALKLMEKEPKDMKANMIPCGNCIGCRLDYSKEWANRGYLHSTTTKDNYFITLTYDEEHLKTPEEVTTSDEITFTELQENDWKGTLWPDDLKQFLKNLRQILARDYNHTGMDFMAAGEYGDKGQRPHFHIILFNCPLDTKTFYDSRPDWKKDVYWKSTIIDRAWGKGIAEVGVCNWNTIAYTARYITKKINGKESEYIYASKGQIREFMRTSRNPGIGFDYYQQNKEEIYKYDKVLIVDGKGAHWETPPRYFDRLYEKENPEHLKEIKQKRQKQMINMLKVKDQETSLNMWEQMQVEMEYKEEQTKTLKRDKIQPIL